jgi:archaeal flagellin FlaB
MRSSCNSQTGDALIICIKFTAIYGGKYPLSHSISTLAVSCNLQYWGKQNWDGLVNSVDRRCFYVHYSISAFAGDSAKMENTPLKKQSRTHRRAVIGIESAIVLIAFVIVAAALSFVVLNMGFSTTQKAKTTIGQGLDTSSSALEIGGSVSAHLNQTAASLDVMTIPLKIASGSTNVDMQKSLTSVKYFTTKVNYDNIYNGTLSGATYTNVKDALDAAVTAGQLSASPLAANGTTPTKTTALVYWSVNNNQNTVLDKSEDATLVIVYAASDRPAQLDKVTAEVIPSIGPPLTVERTIPTLTDEYQNLS